MWSYRKEDLQKDISAGGDYICKNGCYKCKIEGAEHLILDSSNSEAIILHLLTEEGQKARLSIFYKDKKGNEIDFNIAHLNQLLYLTKNKIENINPVAVVENGKQKLKIKALEDKNIGVFIEVGLSKDGKNFEYNLKGFFETGTLKIAREIVEQLPAEKYAAFQEKYKDAVEIVKEAKKDEIQDFAKPYQQKNFTEDIEVGENKFSDSDDDEFPF